MCKRRGGRWDNRFWNFADPAAAQQVLDEIRKRHPDWPVVCQGIDADAAQVLGEVQISSWPVNAGNAACLVPFSLPRSARTTSIKEAPDVRKLLLSGAKGKERVALLYGPAESITAIVHDLQAQGAALTGSLADRWGMGPASSNRKLSVHVAGWAIQIRAQLSDPSHYLVKPKQEYGWNGVNPGEPPKAVPWVGTLNITRKDWPKWKARIADVGLVLEGDDPDARDLEQVSFDISAVGGWLEPARNGYLLHVYQKDGVSFCARRHMRALIGDEMGIGKTAQAIAAAEGCGVPHIVVVCPANARYVWEREIKGWSRGDAIQHLTKKTDRLDPNARWHIVTYDVLAPRAQSWSLNDREEEAAFLNAFPGRKKDVQGRTFPKRVTVEVAPEVAPKFNDPQRIAAWAKLVQRLDNQLVEQIAGAADFLLILDEAHRVKNRDAKRTKTIAQIASTDCKLLMLTGTPLRNNEHEAAALLSLLDPRAAQDLSTTKGYTIQDVKDYLNYFMIRRTKEEVLSELPPKTRQRIDIDELEPAAVEAYLDAIDDARLAHTEALSAGKSEAEARHAAQGHVESARKWLGVSKVGGGVVTDLVTNVVESKGACVVFTAHHMVSDKLLEQLSQAGVRVAVVDGRTPQKERARIVSEFQAGKLDVFIGGINAAGEAITLTRADTVIFVELDWVPATMLQAEDRIHRIGQDRNCQILHLVARCPGFNLDEELISILGSKLERIGNVLDEGTDNIVQAKGAIRTEVLKRMVA